MPQERPAYRPNLHRFALLTSFCTFLLLLAGALVTSTGSSLAVPDWPLSFGQFFPPMTGGVLFEHGHRMVAGTVGVLILFLALALQRWESRPWVRKLGWWALGGVVLQAALGGATVKLHLPTQISVSHAGLAQIVFCLTVALALATSKAWIGEVPGRLKGDPEGLHPWALGTTLLVYCQIFLGAVTRHSGAGLAIPDFPLSFGRWLPTDAPGLALLQFSHTRLGASLVLVLVSWTCFRYCREYQEEKALFYPAAAAGILVWFQCFLGFLILATQKAVIPTSLHVLLGAAILASMLVLTLMSGLLFGKGRGS